MHLYEYDSLKLAANLLQPLVVLAIVSFDDGWAISLFPKLGNQPQTLLVFPHLTSGRTSGTGINDQAVLLVQVCTSICARSYCTSNDTCYAFTLVGSHRADAGSQLTIPYYRLTSIAVNKGWICERRLTGCSRASAEDSARRSYFQIHLMADHKQRAIPGPLSIKHCFHSYVPVRWREHGA